MDAKKSIKILIAFIVLLIIGILIMIFNGFQLSFHYDNATRMEIAINKQFNINEIITLAREVYPEETIKVEKIGAFEDTIGITIKETNEEKEQQIITKLNEKYGTKLDTTSITTYTIPASNLHGMLEPYILPTLITFGIILIVACITYKKNGILKTLLSIILLVIVAEILYGILISICNIKLTQTILIGTIGIMLFSIIYLTKAYEKVITQNSTKIKRV